MTQAIVRPLNVLVLGGPDDDALITSSMGSDARIEHVETAEAALETLRSGRFDVIISRPGDFASLQNLHTNSQAAAILDSFQHGVCILGQKCEILWMNPRMLTFPPEVRQRVQQCCTETLNTAKDLLAHQVAPRRFNFTTRQNEHYEVTVTPVADLHRRIRQVAAVVSNATSTRRLQDQIDAIDRAGCELLSLDVDQFSRLDMAGRLQLLEERILRCTQELLHFDNFVIFVLDKKTKRLEPVLVWGLSEDRAHTELYATPEGNGICGHVASRGRSYICPDTLSDPRYRPGIDNARSSLTVPLLFHEEVVGVANFESTRVAAFSEDDRQFAEIFARYIALGLHILELLVSERKTTTGKVGSNVMAEITAPLNDILTETETLLEDYIGHDDLRHRLRALSENAVKIRESIKVLTSPEASLAAARGAPKELDPVLQGKRVLLADDEDIIRETVRDVLTNHGCVVCAVEDGAAAIEAIKQQPFDLVLSDIKMPNKNGYEVFAAAKEANPAVPVILATGFGYDPNHTMVRARREGLTAVLFKPFKVDQLLCEIRTALKATQPA